MITIETESHKFNYYGEILVKLQKETIMVESHSRQLPYRNEAELDIWCSDIYDWFWIEDVISIKGT